MAFSVFKLLRNLVPKASQTILGRGAMVLGRDDADTYDQPFVQDATAWLRILTDKNIDSTFAGTSGKVPDSAAVKALIGSKVSTYTGAISGTFDLPSCAVGELVFFWGTPSGTVTVRLPSGGTYRYLSGAGSLPGMATSATASGGSAYGTWSAVSGYQSYALFVYMRIS